MKAEFKTYDLEVELTKVNLKKHWFIRLGRPEFKHPDAIWQEFSDPATNDIFPPTAISSRAALSSVRIELVDVLKGSQLIVEYLEKNTTEGTVVDEPIGIDSRCRNTITSMTEGTRTTDNTPNQDKADEDIIPATPAFDITSYRGSRSKILVNVNKEDDNENY